MLLCKDKICLLLDSAAQMCVLWVANVHLSFIPYDSCCCYYFLQHKVLLQQFNTGDDRAQKRQPIRGSDEGENVFQPVQIIESQNKISPLGITPWAHRIAFLGCPCVLQMVCLEVPVCIPVIYVLELCAWSWGACSHSPDSASPPLLPLLEGEKDYLRHPLSTWQEGGWRFADASPRWSARGTCRAGLPPRESTLALSSTSLAAIREAEMLAVIVCLVKISPKNHDQNKMNDHDKIFILSHRWLL